MKQPSRKSSPRRARVRRREFVNNPVPPLVEKYLLNPTETSLALGVTRQTLSRWAKGWKLDPFHGRGPQPVRFGSKVLYRWDSVFVPAAGAPDFLTRMRDRLAQDIANEKPGASEPRYKSNRNETRRMRIVAAKGAK